MLREADVFEAQGFSFAAPAEAKAAEIVSVESGAQGATATIADAHLLFNSDLLRSGNDLHLNGHDGERAIVRDYFSSDERVALMSREGARLSPDIVDALTAAVAPGQYAQAGQPAPTANDAVGRVVNASADSTVLRNGVPVAVRPGDAVLRADVLQTAGGTMAVTFNDGSTLNLTANTRIVVSEFVYAPNGTGNSQLLDLVQGSLTFISGEVAHSGNMSIGTPVATMGIRGTVGGVTTASDGTVQFYVSQSATGAVIINQQGQIIASVVQDGPLIIVRPAGPLQVVADEIQKSPQQLAVELQALQQIVSIKAVGDQLIQQFFQPQQQNPNPQSGQGPHTQIQVDDKVKITLFSTEGEGGGGGFTPPSHAVIELPDSGPDGLPPIFGVPLPVNLPPVTFAPNALTTAEDTALTFGGARAISIVDNDSSSLTVTLSVTNGVLALATLAGLTFSSGGTGQASMTFSGSPAAIAAALNGLTFTPAQDYFGPATLSITKSDGGSAPTTTTVGLTVTPVNDAPVIGGASSAPVGHDANGGATVVNAALTVSDVDSATLSGATVKISGNFAVGEDVLSFTSQGGITGSYDAQTGVLTLSGVASLADYQEVLRSVTYENTSSNWSTAPRTIEFQVSDGSSQNTLSGTVSTVVQVTSSIGAPVLKMGGHVADHFDSQAYDLNSGAANWTSNWIENENGDYVSSPTTGEIQVTIDPSVPQSGFRLFLSDDDNESGVADTIQRSADLYGATSATLSFDYRRQINSGDPDDVVKIWASNDGQNFTLIGQIGASGYGTFIDQAYQHYSVDLTGYISYDTTIRFSVDDGADDTDWFYIDNVKIDYSGPPSIFVEGGAAVPISPLGASISDSDSTMLQSATITITNARDGDLLSIGSTLPPGIVASNYNTGILTLVGAATLADYQTALAQIQFSNTGDNPGSADRAIEVVVSDGTANSNTSTVIVKVTPVNDLPQAQDDHIVMAGSNIMYDVEYQTDYVSFSVDYLAFNDDPDGNEDMFTLALAGQNASQTTSANGAQVYLSGEVSFEPTQQQSVPFTDTFQYTITPAAINQPASTATVTLSMQTGPQLTGGATNDIIVGSADNEIMTGNAGKDAFVFRGDFGEDTITDFVVGTDKLVFSDTVFESAQDVIDAAAGLTNAVISDGTHSVTLAGVSASSLTVDDIIIHNGFMV